MSGPEHHPSKGISPGSAMPAFHCDLDSPIVSGKHRSAPQPLEISPQPACQLSGGAAAGDWAQEALFCCCYGPEWGTSG